MEMMMRKIILLVFILATLAACTKTPTMEAVTPTLVETTPGSIQAAPTVETIISTPITESTIPSPMPESHLDTADLSSYLAAWNSGEVEVIRSLYTEDARYYPEAEMQNLSQGQPIDVLVSDPSFAERVREHEGMTMRILGEPMMIYDKLVAFLYRWENEAEGYDGAALLRYENDKIFLHSFIQSDQLTPNPRDDSTHVEEITLDDLMRAWVDTDYTAAQELYETDAVILSDEDLAQAAWRDYSSPAKLDRILSQFAGWKPTIIDTPKRIGDFAIFAWHWEAFDYPKGYGVRLVHFQDAQIGMDIRYAIRPWEANGKPFLSP
jgi:hypothetical protein